MKFRSVVIAIMLCALAGVAAADNFTWNGAADSADWYAFNAVPDTINPVVWVNNWGEQIFQYPGEDPPEHDDWNWPTGPDSATIPISGAELFSQSAALSDLNIGLGGTILLRHELQCIAFNIAGLVTMNRDGRVYQCAVQDDGGTGILRSEMAHWATVNDPTLHDVIISCPVEIPDDMSLGLLGNIQLNNIISVLGNTHPSRLVIDGDVTLAGNGWVETSTSTTNEICRHFNHSHRFTNQSTIHAAGKIGCNTMAITNEGLIVADRTNRLTVDPDDTPADGQDPLINTGTMKASGGGTLRLDRGTFNNTGGTITAENASVVELHDYADVSGGTLQTTGSGEFQVSGAGSVVRDLTLSAGSILVVPDTRSLMPQGTVTIDGELRLDGTGVGATLVVRSPVFLDGAGEVVLSDADGNRFSFAGFDGGYRLTSSIPVRGATGSVYGLAHGIALTNNSTITADGTNMLLINPVGSPLDGQPGVVNTGTLRAVNGATMRLHEGSFDNTGGIIRAENASVVELHDYADVSGGVLQTTGSGELQVSGANSVIRDLTLSTGSTFVIPNTRSLRPEGTVTIDGELLLDSTGGGATLVVRSPVFLDGAGEVVLSDSTGNRFSSGGFDGGHRLTSSIPIRGATGGVYGLAHDIALTNHASITADGTNSLYIDPHNTPIDGQPGVVNTGTLRATDGATMRLAGGSFDNTGGVIEALNGSLIELHDGASITGGQLRSVGTGIVRSTTGFDPPTVSDLTVEGRLESPGAAHLRLGGTVVNNGVIEAESYIRPSGELTLAGIGELRLVNNAEIRPDPTGVTNGGDHTLRVTGSGQTHIHRAFVHQGSLIVDVGAGLRLRDSCDAQNGSTMQVDGTLQPDQGLMMAGELAGAGTINGAVNLSGTGVLVPGSSTGTLTTGSLTIGDGALYQWQASAMAGSDLVDVNGTLDMGTSTLTVAIEVLDGDVPDRVVLFEFNTLASAPDVSQFLLTGGYEFTGVDTSNNELALTGVEYTGVIFADGFESGDVDMWSSAVGSTMEVLRFDPATDGLSVQVAAPHWLVDRPERTVLVDGLDADGGPVLALISRAGVLRVGVRCADGWRWSTPLAPAGLELELVWRPGEVQLYDAGGPVGGVVGEPDLTPPAVVRAHSTRQVGANPAAAVVRGRMVPEGIARRTVQ
jgi:hypothetical protein